MPWPSSAVNSGPRRFSQAHGITKTRRNSQPTCSTAFCSSPVGRPDLQSQAKIHAKKLKVEQDVTALSATSWDGFGNFLGWLWQRFGMATATNWDGLTATATSSTMLPLP